MADLRTTTIFITSILLAINTHGQDETKLPFESGACHCKELQKPVGVLDGPGGNIIDSLPAGTPVVTMEQYDGWLLLEYFPGLLTKKECDELGKERYSKYPVKKGYANIRQVPGFTLLAHNFNPSNHKGTLLDIRNDNERYTVYARNRYEISVPIYVINAAGEDEPPGQIDYWILYTGMKEQPFMMIYSGHAGDMHHEPGALILFGRKFTKTWYPNPGNRTRLLFNGIGKNSVIVQEAYFCMLKVKTTLRVTLRGINRAKGDLENKVMEFDNDEYAVLKQDIKLFKDRSMTTSRLLKAGTQIGTIRFIEADFMRNITKVGINGTTGWVKTGELRKSCPAIDAHAGCGAG